MWLASTCVRRCHWELQWVCCHVTVLSLLCSGTSTDLWQCMPSITGWSIPCGLTVKYGYVRTYGGLVVCVWVGGYCNQGNNAFQTLNLSRGEASMTVVCFTWSTLSGDVLGMYPFHECCIVSVRDCGIYHELCAGCCRYAVHNAGIGFTLKKVGMNTSPVCAHTVRTCLYISVISLQPVTLVNSC